MAKEFVVYSATKAEFEALVSSGEVDTSQMGIIAETGEMWWNGEYRPIAETVPFAKDLTGRIEATPEEFTFRPSAGDKSIRDESALIKKIKGNTIVWNQMWDGSASLNTGLPTLVNSSTLTVGNYYIDWKPTVNFTSRLFLYLNKMTLLADRKYLFLSFLESNLPSSIYFAGVNISSGNKIVSKIIQRESDIVNGDVSFTSPLGGSEFTTEHYIRGSFFIFDITLMFGYGYEPSTVDEFKRLFPQTFFPHCPPELRSMRIASIETNGFNQWDEEWEIGVYKTYTASGDGSKGNNSNYIRSADLIRVIPNTEYYVTSGSGSLRIGFYDSNRSYLGYDFVVYRKEGAFVTPERASYMSFYLDVSGVTTYNKDICINISHSGVRNGEYEPYRQNRLDIPIIADTFKDGMHGIGEVFDELNEERSIKRIGIIDLGTLTWTKNSTHPVLSADIPDKAKGSLIIKSTILCNNTRNFAYTIIDSITSDVFYGNSGGRTIFIKTTAYADASSFKAAMDGVLLIYEMENEVVTSNENVVQLNYQVLDFGTESAVSSNNSAPFKADIVYQFNATDRVRENSMNISKLSKEYALLNSRALTTDEQTFTTDQKAQVAANLGGNVTNGLARYVGGKLPLKKISAPDDNGAEQTYVLPNASDEDKESADGVIATESFVDDGYVPRPSGTSADKTNKVLVYSDNRTYDSGVGIAQEVSDITEGATNSIPKSGHVKQYVESLVGERLSMHDSKIVVVVEDTYFDVNNAQKVALSTATKEILAKAKTLADNITIRQQDNFAVVKAIKLSDGVIDVGSIVYALPTASDDTLATADEVLSTESYVAEYMNTHLPTAVATATERITTWPLVNSIQANTIYDISGASITDLVIYSFIGGSGTTYAFDDVWRVRFAGLSSALSVIPTVRWENGVAPNYTEWAICDLEFRRLPNGEYIGKWTIYK